MANELKYHMNMLNSIDKKVGGPGNWTYIIDALNSIDQNLSSYIPDQKQAIADYVEQVIASIPPEYSALKEQAYNAYPNLTATGNPIYFDDGAKDIPVKELIVNLEPKQSGSGNPSPSNVRPISGFDGVKVKRTGKNLLLSGELRIYNGGTTQVVFESDGMHISGAKPQGYWADYLVFFSTQTLKANQSYILSLDIENSSLTWGLVLLMGSTELYVVTSSTKNITITPNSDISYDRFRVSIRTDDSADVNAIAKPMLRLASANEEYELGTTEQTYSITFPSSVGTVYSGTLDVLTGKLVVDRYNLHIDPAKIPDGYIHFDVLTNNARIGNLILSTHFGLTSAYYAKYSSEGTFRNGALSNWSVEKNKGYSSDTSGFYFSGADRFYLFCPKSIFATQDAAGFKQYLTNNPLYICYQLANPITYQLAPSDVTTLLMGNTVWSDNGEINLTYRADTTTVINKLKEA